MIDIVGWLFAVSVDANSCYEIKTLFKRIRYSRIFLNDLVFACDEPYSFISFMNSEVIESLQALKT
jgi:hypothetical protein